MKEYEYIYHHIRQVILIINAVQFFVPHDIITIISARRVVSLSAGKGGDTETADSEKTTNGCRRDIYLSLYSLPTYRNSK